METSEFAPVDEFDVREDLAYQPESSSEVLLSTENADAYVSDIAATLNRAGILPDRNRIDAYDAYVADPEFAPELRELGALLIDARQYAKVDERIDAANALLDRGVGDKRQLSEQIHKDLELMVEFDHQLREWLTDNGEQLHVSQVTEWLYTASGDQKWATKRVGGIAGEIAVGRRLAEEALEGGAIKEVYYTTKQDDLRGMDLVVVMQTSSGKPEEIGIDVKTVAGTLNYTDSFSRNEKSVDGRRVYTVSIATNEIGKGFVAEPNALNYQLSELKHSEAVPAEPEIHPKPANVTAIRHAKSLHKGRHAA